MKVSAKEYPRFKKELLSLLDDLDAEFVGTPPESHDEGFGRILDNFSTRMESVVP